MAEVAKFPSIFVSLGHFAPLGASSSDLHFGSSSCIRFDLMSVVRLLSAHTRPGENTRAFPKASEDGKSPRPGPQIQHLHLCYEDAV